MSRTEHAIVLSALLIACASCTSLDAQSWQKTGVSEQTTSQDMAECRESAEKETLRRYPYRAGSPVLGATGAILSQQRDDNSRATTETSLLNSCMQGRGYQRAPASR